MKDKTPLNPVHMSVKEWYLLLVEKNVTKREVDQEGRMEMIPCRVEEKYHEVCWPDVYRISRLTCIHHSLDLWNGTYLGKQEIQEKYKPI